MRGDDTFVVLFGSRGFVVWCFDPDVTLRIKDSERDMGLKLDDKRANPFKLPTISSYQFCEQIEDVRGE